MCLFHPRYFRHLAHPSHLAQYAVILLVLVLAGACSSSDPDLATNEFASAEGELSEVPEGVTSADSASIKDQVRADGLNFRHSGPIDSINLADAWVARNATQQLEAAFGDARMVARGQGSQAWTLELKTIAWGRTDLTTQIAAPTRHIDGARLEYRRPGITEWYINGGKGIEHGFDIAEKPAGDGPLRVEVAVGGKLKPKVMSDDTVMFVSEAGEHVLRYTGLLVEDARGFQLPAHFEVKGSAIAIVVDDRDATYPIVIDPWVQQAKLQPSDGAVEDRFGFSVAMSGNTIVVGAPYDDDQRSNSGSAYVFEGGGFTQATKLTASDAAANSLFGWSVAVSGNTIAVGAPSDDDNGDNSGSTYVFEDSGTGFVQSAKLLSNDGTTGDNFGTSVSLWEDTIVVGVPLNNDNGENSGSAYVFQDNGSGFVQTSKLLPDDGAASDLFGASVKVSENTIVVGAFASGDGSGSVYVFEDSETGFMQTAKLTASDGEAGDWFGYSVAIDGNTLAVGARGITNNGINSAGSAYVFEDNGTEFVQTAKLLPNDNAVFNLFGGSVAVLGDTIVVGARQDDDIGTDSGSIYVFENSGAGFMQSGKLNANDASAGDNFGTSVALSKDMIAVGAWGDNDNGADSGSAYVFELPNNPPTAHDFLRADGTQIETTEGTAATIALEGIDDDGDELTFEIVNDPTNGTLSITTADGVQAGTFDGVDTTTLDVTYTPTQAASSDRFTYRVDDGNGGAAPGIVEISITSGDGTGDGGGTGDGDGNGSELPADDDESGDDGGGCSTANASSNGLWALIVLALLRLRHRKVGSRSTIADG